jgi:protein SCO1/2
MEWSRHIARPALFAAVILFASACADGGSDPQAAAPAPAEPPAAVSELLPDKDPFLHRPMDREAPGFTLIDYTGETVELSDFEGKWVLIDWVYTNCLTVCPLLTTEMNFVRLGLEDIGADDVQFVSISFDPEVDTPAALKSHAVAVGGDVEGWAWLTGDQEATDAVAAAYGVSYDPVAAISGVPQFDHTALMVIVDPDGRERHRYLGTGWSQDVLATLEADRAAAEAPVVAAAEPEPVAIPAVASTPQEVTVSAEDLLANAITLAWEDWELEPGVATQTLHQFPTTGEKTAYIDFLRDEAASRGAEVYKGALSAMKYDLIEWGEDQYTAVGYTDQNIAVMLEGTSATDLMKALAVIDDDWCCSSPE